MTAPAIRVPGLDEVPAAVEAVLEDFLDGKARAGADSRILQFTGILRGLLAAGGKRLRPVLCCCGWQAAGGGDLAPVVSAAASLELFHTFALIHDDVMDRSPTRRGRPTVHRTLATRVSGRPGRLDAERFGDNGAILLGDLAMVWSDELLHVGGLTSAQLAAARPVLDAMRSEVVYGQYLDLLAGTDLGSGLEAALTVVRYKTAKYTVERPLQLGAALAGGDGRVLEACSAYGVPLGEAFQLRDDVLGVFGDEEETGKPAGDDLREGKRTLLIAYARERAGDDVRTRIDALVGDPELGGAEIAFLREQIVASGALDRVEERIAAYADEAVSALAAAPIDADAVGELRQLLDAATQRTA